MATDDQAVSGVVLTFFSTASAVGKTLLSCNMASELARQGATVVLCDLDLQFGDICNYLHLSPDQTIADAQESMKRMGSAFDIRECLTPYMYEDTVFQVLAAPHGLDEAYNIETDSVKKIINELRMIYNYVIIDTTSMFSNVNMMLLDLSTIVTFLGVVDFIPTIKNMKIGSTLLSQLNYKDKVRLVLNRSNAKTRIGMDDVEKLLGQEFYHILPNDFKSATRSIQDGVPLVLADRRTELSRALRDLVSRYTNRPYYDDDDEEGYEGDVPAHEHKKSWLGKLFSK